MRNGTYYQKLKGLVDSGRLSLTLIIAPPRTNSSLVEHIMGLSPDVAHESHEPFLASRKPGFDPDQGYKEIYESIGGEEFEQSGERTSVVVKEMTHWIAVNQEYRHLVELTKHPVLVLIRNPLLSVESRIQRVLNTIDMRMNLDLQRWLLDTVSQRSGFKDWGEFSTSDRGSSDAFLDSLRDHEAAARLYDTALLTTQNQLLDYVSQQDGYANWRDLVKRKLYSERDFSYFDGIFRSNARRVGFEESEFKQLGDEVKFLESAGIEHYVFDTTDLRATPEPVIKELCARLDIAYTPEMLNWGMEPVDFHTTQTQEFERVWYDTLHASTTIRPPSEVPPTLSSFPKFVQDYLVAHNLPIYAEISKKKVLPAGTEHTLNEQEIELAVTAENIDSLKKLGIVDESVGEGRISVKLKYVDPIYAVTNEPTLFEDAEFRKRTTAYERELTLVHEVMTGEPTREQRFRTGEKKFR